MSIEVIEQAINLVQDWRPDEDRNILDAITSYHSQIPEAVMGRSTLTVREPFEQYLAVMEGWYAAMQYISAYLAANAATLIVANEGIQIRAAGQDSWSSPAEMTPLARGAEVQIMTNEGSAVIIWHENFLQEELAPSSIYLVRDGIYGMSAVGIPPLKTDEDNFYDRLSSDIMADIVENLVAIDELIGA